MQGKLNAYATTMTGRPIMRETTTMHYTATHKHNTTQQDKPIIITRNKGYNLWQWLKKYCK